MTAASQPNAPCRIARALISVSDKTGLIELAGFLAKHKVEIISTGGSARAIAEAGIGVREVADYTGFPEMLDGRVKTLHPKVHGGILGRRDLAAHRDAMAKAGIAPIDLVVIDLYPFEAAVAKNASPDACIEQIDIGGPAMIRSAAKNAAFVTVVVEPADYQAVMDEMAANAGAIGGALRQTFAAKAFARTSAYDSAIAGWMAKLQGIEYPERLTIAGTRAEILRYGENPHQTAAFYKTDQAAGLAGARQAQGKALSYNNLNDADAGLELVAEFTGTPAVVIVKHANPCGVATASDLAKAWDRALACDPVSAFGGIVALNRTLDAATAAKICEIFTEVILAPDASDDALAILAKKKNLRLLLLGDLPEASAPGRTLRSIGGGFLVQSRDHRVFDEAAFKVVSQRAPTATELADLRFAFLVAKHVKSNAIVFAKDGATVGIGAGQMSRVDAARIAALKSADAAKALGADAPLTQGSVAASDAFFPFADGLAAIAAAGATAVIQPGGSVRDPEVIAAADAAGLAMVFTGMRHFRH
jgi:phosphoribosylaminoimidazolecarboxamide formyltransferase/IMP cyclohydrolase